MRFNIEPTILLKQQTHVRNGREFVIRKGLETESNLKRCFPWFRSLSFNFGNSKEYSQIKSLQAEVLTKLESATNRSTKLLTTINGLDDDDLQVVWRSLKSVANIASTMNSFSTNRTSFLPASLFTADNEPVISMPMADVTSFFPHFVQFQEPIQQAFVFDNEGCCGVLPDVDEIVFVSSASSPL